MARFLLVLLLGCSGLLGGCAISKNPVGSAIDAQTLQDISEDLSATWMNPKGELEIDCDTQGGLVITFEEEDRSSGEMKTERHEGLLRAIGEDFFIINLKGDEKEKDGYVFFLTSLDDDEQVVLWTPNLDTLEELIKAGKLTGEKGKYDVTLEGDGEAIAKTLLEEGLESTFTWDKPAVFWRKESE